MDNEGTGQRPYHSRGCDDAAAKHVILAAAAGLCNVKALMLDNARDRLIR